MKTSVLCINAALTISCYLILTFSAVHLTQSSQGKSFLFFLSDFVFRGVFRSSSVLCVNFQCCDVRCELGITNDLGEQANFRRGRGLSACVFLATVDIVQLTRLGLLFCFYNRAWWCCHPSVGQVPPPHPRRPPICKALFVTLLMGILPPWEGCRVPLKVPVSQSHPSYNLKFWSTLAC